MLEFSEPFSTLTKNDQKIKKINFDIKIEFLRTEGTGHQ